MDNKKKYAIVEFKDGLQIVPATWLSSDLRKSKWPRHYISNDRYDKAVKLMEVPDCTWEEHTVLKIYATSSNYAVARQKLKLAEEMSDINSCTDEDRQKLCKKSRKIRAAKMHDSSSYEYTNDESDSEQAILSDLPKPPIKNVYKETSTKTTRVCKNNTIKYSKIADTKLEQESTASYNFNNIEEVDFPSQSSFAISEYSDYENVVRRSPNLDLNSSQDSQCIVNVNPEPERRHDINKCVFPRCDNHEPERRHARGDVKKCVIPRCDTSLPSLNLNSKRVSGQCAETSIDITERLHDENVPPNRHMLNTSIDITERLHNENVLPNRHMSNYTEGFDFERYIIKKFQHLELKMSNNLKLTQKILEKVSNTAQIAEEAQEKIDIFQHLPLSKRRK
ncbi:uncharacterized protein LOC105254747 isoform X3 [Camponotus floridanus]|uniref:uncharacterized protein LOC105254747 isoform X3 n=1 Tax=Camponotus floridanus TaxID=104421 RepID=UPI000DC676A1|nr:uncharacterized protein LOC105254747 isoform X3 [Camponotus floridanus]